MKRDTGSSVFVFGWRSQNTNALAKNPYLSPNVIPVIKPVRMRMHERDKKCIENHCWNILEKKHFGDLDEKMKVKTDLNDV
jgi:hypothetical protein